MWRFLTATSSRRYIVVGCQSDPIVAYQLLFHRNVPKGVEDDKLPWNMWQGETHHNGSPT